MNAITSHNPQFDQLMKMEDEIIMLRGCLDALILIDDHVPHEIVQCREVQNALHTIMSSTLRRVERQFDGLFCPVTRSIAS
jgi:hypothetical protein